MKKVRKFKYYVFISLVTLVLFSCKNSTLKVENKTETTQTEKTSKLLNDNTFLNKIHLIRNSINNTSMLVRGDGTIILKTMEPETEQIGIINDIDENITNYVYKIYSGEGLKKEVYGDGEMSFESMDLTRRIVFYDKFGKEIDLHINTWGANFTTKDKIIYRDSEAEYYENDLKVYDVNTKEITTLPYRIIYAFNGNFLMSTEGYDENAIGKEVTIVYDDNFNELKRIEGYSIDGVDNRRGVYLLVLSKSSKNGEEIIKKYNYMDTNYNFIFSEDIDERIWGDTFPIASIRKGNIVYDYDFSKLKKVSEDRPYIEDDNKGQNYFKEIEKFEDNRSKLEENTDKYYYVETFYHDGNVLYFAHKVLGDENSASNPCDVYNDNLELIATFDRIDSIFSNEGYFLANNDTIYNINLDIVKKFDTKCIVDRFEKFGKVFFTNSTAVDYSNKKDFILFDANFNPLFEHINDIESYTYNDYIVLCDEKDTLFIDKDMKVAKKIEGRTLAIKSWYTEETDNRLFVDLSNDRSGIIDKDYNILVEGLKSIESLTDKYFTYQNGFQYGIMDYDGIPVFTYSIFDTMNEDAVAKDFNGKFVEEYDDNY